MYDVYDIVEVLMLSLVVDVDVVYVFMLMNDVCEVLVCDLVLFGLCKFCRGREDVARSFGDSVLGLGSDVFVVCLNCGGY